VYVSNSPTIFVDPETKTARTEILARLYGMDFNLIPVNGKHPPCIEWKPYQTQRVRRTTSLMMSAAGVWVVTHRSTRPCPPVAINRPA
jgi:hypothetical protein